MDQQRFDGLTRRFASVRSRRAAVAAVAGALFAASKVAEPAEAAIRMCHLPNAVCNADKQCCSRTCVDGACGCVKKGGSCYQIGFACCSGVCKRGRCK
ncbi:MAG: hypothetical protein ACR2J8_10870 [Thermomicrobiales bacterium]